MEDLSKLSVQELVARARVVKDGVCDCPVFPDGRVGFRQACPVHGRSRADFDRLTRERSELFGRLKVPASVHGTVKK